MGSSHYMKDLPPGTLSYDDQRCLIMRDTFDMLDDYTRSFPTAPSVGRVWKRNFGWSPDMEDNWFIYVSREPEGDEETHSERGSAYVYHDSRKAVIL